MKALKNAVDLLDRYLLAGELGAAKRQFEVCCKILEEENKDPEQNPEIIRVLAGILALEGYQKKDDQLLATA